MPVTTTHVHERVTYWCEPDTDHCPGCEGSAPPAYDAPIVHAAAVGLPLQPIIHPPFECAWCDAERYREAASRNLEAAALDERARLDRA